MTYSSIEKTMGTPDLSSVIVSGAVGTPGISGLPSVTMDTQLGTIVNGRDATLGDGEFIFLKVPVSTTVTAGLLYQWDKNYTVTVVPVSATSKNTGVSVAAAVNSVSSNASSVQYTWFQISGQATVLKTAVAIAPQSKIYMTVATAGRIYATVSAGAQILGARSGNTATISAGVSSVTVFLNRSAIEGA